MHGIMAQKYGGNLKAGAITRSLPPAPSQQPVETFVRSQTAAASAPTREQMQAAFQAQAAPPAQAAYQPQPRQLTEGDLAIQAALAQINADQAAARQALATSRLEAGKKTLEGVAKTSADLHA